MLLWHVRRSGRPRPKCTCCTTRRAAKHVCIPRWLVRARARMRTLAWVHSSGHAVRCTAPTVFSLRALERCGMYRCRFGMNLPAGVTAETLDRYHVAFHGTQRNTAIEILKSNNPQLLLPGELCCEFVLACIYPCVRACLRALNRFANGKPRLLLTLSLCGQDVRLNQDMRFPFAVGTSRARSSEPTGTRRSTKCLTQTRSSCRPPSSRCFVVHRLSHSERHIPEGSHHL